MKKLNLFIVVVLLLASCNSGVKQSDYDKLQAELTECRKTVEDLQNTPQVRLTNGQQYYANNDFENAKKELNVLVEKYNGTEEAKKAQSIIADIEKQEKEKRDAEERKRTLGFKALKEKTSVSVEDVTVNFTSVNTGPQWIFDNYGREWRYRSAERGDIYLLSKISISSESKNPKLPPISVYKISNGSLSLIGTMGYEFSRWKDYGTYLGNNADFGNDFAHTKTIPFSCGLSLSKEDMNNEVIFVVVKNFNCFYRDYDRFSNPPVSYKSSSCGVKSTLTVDDFDSDYTLVKIFNKNKL